MYNEMDDILKKYTEEQVETKEEKKVEVTQENNVIKMNLGLSKPNKVVKVLEDIYGNDYVVNSNTKCLRTIYKIGETISKLDKNEKVEKMFGMIKDMFFVLFGKEATEEIFSNNSQVDDIEQQLKDLTTIIKYAIALISNKTIEEINKKINMSEVEIQEANFQERTK